LLEENENPSSIQLNDGCFHLEDADRVHYALGQISLPHREVLTLYFLQDLTIEEIANVLDVPAGTVKSRLYYARLALRSALEKED
jgi:RNA polymerase sigma-70 factor (ECF subfamily)